MVPSLGAAQLSMQPIGGGVLEANPHLSTGYSPKYPEKLFGK